MPTRKKFGLRSIRPPDYLVAALHDEREDLGKSAPTLYCVRRVTPREEAQQHDTYVAYLCNADGRRLAGVKSHYFTPRTHARKPRTAEPKYPNPGAPSPEEREGRSPFEPDEYTGAHDGVSN